MHPNDDQKLLPSPRFDAGFGERMHVINPSPHPMNHQGISEISFEETYSVPPEQTARALFSRLPHGSDYAQRLIECLATGYLVAVVESICIREMQRHVDAVSEVVVGRTIELEHKGPIPPGSTLKLRGWVERLGERSAKFRVKASDDHELVCDGCVILVVVPRTSMESRIAEKVVALGTNSDGDLIEDARDRRVSLDSLSHLEPQTP
jgi:fluoroacetyl-CoA thioesterase